MSHRSQTFSVDEIFIQKMTLEECEEICRQIREE